MRFVDLRQTLFGTDVDVRGTRILDRITVGVLAAWIAMGGDLLGSCVYGPDVLGRASGGARFVLLLATWHVPTLAGALALIVVLMVVNLPLLREDDAVRLQTRLEREKIPMTVISIPIDT